MKIVWENKIMNMPWTFEDWVCGKRNFRRRGFLEPCKTFLTQIQVGLQYMINMYKGQWKLIGVLCNTSKCYCNTICILMFQEVQSNDSVVWRLVNRIWKMMDVKKFCDIPFRLSCVMLQIPIKTVIKSSTVFSSLSVLLATFYKTIAAKM